VENHRNARFAEADFDGARFHGVNFSNVKISDAWLFNVDISGLVGGLTVNGIDVGGYVESEMNRLHPERLLLVPTDADGVRRAWETVESFTAATLEQARALPLPALDESVDGEWSFIETLRHLVFATDRWITGPVLDDANPFQPMGLPNPPLDEAPAGIFDLDARPPLADVVAVRRERMDRVAGLIRNIDETELSRGVPSPNGGMTSVMDCVRIVFREEWWHDQYARRDLAILASRT
jgi:hypothetical protein